jgi:predicted MFS family arabinose efflux permease
MTSGRPRVSDRHHTVLGNGSKPQWRVRVPQHITKIGSLVTTQTSETSTFTPFPWVGLLSLACAIFVSVTSEFLPTGLLPEMAQDMGVGLSTTGLLVTIFAGTVVIATTPLAVLTQRYSRKPLVVLVLGVIALANVLAALAPSYGMLVSARVLGGLAHGLFWAVVAAYSAHLVPKHQLGRAVAITAGGGSAAFVLGVPAGTTLGHALGWRAAFAILGGIVLVIAVVVIKFLPPVNHQLPLKTGEAAVPLRKDRSLKGVILVCAIIVIIMAGQNTFYTYIAPWLIQAAGFSSASVAFLLLLLGGSGAVGLVLAGLAADRFPKRGFALAVLAVVGSVFVLALVSANPVVVVVAFVLWGTAFGGVPAMLQTRMLHTASYQMRNLAAALQTTAFNVGIGGGALIGGALLDGPGIRSLPIVEIMFLTTGLALSLGADAIHSKRVHRQTRRVRRKPAVRG